MCLRIFYLLIILTFIGFFSCENKDSNAEEYQTLKLISPKGYSLASSAEDLMNKIVNISDIKASKNKIEIQDIKYFETAISSVGVVNYFINESRKSILFVLYINENSSIFKDSNNLHVIDLKNDSKKISSSDKVLKIVNKSISRGPTGGFGVAGLPDIGFECTLKSCCLWTNPGPNHYNCGCASSLIMTTSDGCGIEVLEL